MKVVFVKICKNKLWLKTVEEINFVMKHVCAVVYLQQSEIMTGLGPSILIGFTVHYVIKTEN